MAARLHLAEAIDEARRLALALAPEAVPIDGAMGRVLAEDVASMVDLPAGDASLMDGWAVRADDLPGTVTVVGESRAGAPWQQAIGSGQAVAISTGGLLPPGADTVVPLEEGAVDAASVTVGDACAAGAHVRPGGEDLRRGDVVVPAGTQVRAHHVGAIAAAGHATVMVRSMPRAAVVVCGSELLQPGAAPEPGMVFDANGHGLPAQLRQAGAQVVSCAVVGDDAGATVAAIEAATADAQLLVVAGGMSVGPHDHARAALEHLGLVASFTRLAVRPGQPSMMGLVGECRVLGVPGNPAAAAVGVHVLGRAILGAEAPQGLMPLGTTVAQHPSLSVMLRCRDVDGAAHPLAVQSSGSVTSLAGADLIACIPPGNGTLAEGSQVQAWRL